MHIQARASKKGSAFIDDEGLAGQSVAISASYGRGVLSELLGHLDGAGFNLRAASGYDIELGGEFAFWADRRVDANGDPIDANHDEATRRAGELLENEGFTVDFVEVHRRKLADEPGRCARSSTRSATPACSCGRSAWGPPTTRGSCRSRSTRSRPPAEPPSPDLGQSRSAGGATSPARAASIAASIRLLTPSLSRMWVTWTLAVFGLMNSSSAIWPFVRPAATSASTSDSRADRPRSANGGRVRGRGRGGSSPRPGRGLAGAGRRGRSSGRRPLADGQASASGQPVDQAGAAPHPAVAVRWPPRALPRPRRGHRRSGTPRRRGTGRTRPGTASGSRPTPRPRPSTRPDRTRSASRDASATHRQPRREPPTRAVGGSASHSASARSCGRGPVGIGGGEVVRSAPGACPFGAVRRGPQPDRASGPTRTVSSLVSRWARPATTAPPVAARGRPSSMAELAPPRAGRYAPTSASISPRRQPLRRDQPRREPRPACPRPPKIRAAAASR